jgi:hypothetical protein
MSKVTELKAEEQDLLSLVKLFTVQQVDSKVKRWGSKRGKKATCKCKLVQRALGSFKHLHYLL